MRISQAQRNPTMLSRHLPLVLLNENSKILGYHSGLNYVPGIFFILFYFFDFTCVISVCLMGSYHCWLFCLGIL